MSSRVTRTSCTRRPRWIAVANAAHNAPDAAAPSKAATTVSAEALSGQCRATAAAPAPPNAIWPSAPMLMTPARKQIATPPPASRYGVARLRADPDLMGRSDRAHRHRGECGQRIVSGHGDEKRSADQGEADRDRHARRQSLAQMQTKRSADRGSGGRPSKAMLPSRRSPGHPQADLPEIGALAGGDACESPRSPSPRSDRRLRAPPRVRMRNRRSPRPASRNARTRSITNRVAPGSRPHAA